jgi:hypothetical protein
MVAVRRERVGLTHLHIRLAQALLDVAACICSRQDPVQQLELASSRLAVGQSCHGGLRGVVDLNPLGGCCGLLSRLGDDHRNGLPGVENAVVLKERELHSDIGEVEYRLASEARHRLVREDGDDASGLLRFSDVDPGDAPGGGR